MAPKQVLVVDGDAAQRSRLTARLGRAGYLVTSCASARDALAPARTVPDLAIVEQRLPDGDALDLIERLRAINPRLEVVVLTARATVAGAVAALKRGAFDYLSRPCKAGELEAALARAAVRRTQGPRPAGGVGLIGRAGPMVALKDRIAAVGAARATVLVCGESGVGKELVARAIHAASPRAARPFLALNCAALSRDLIESELFGHRKGAFTSAVDDHPGLFRAAEGGTLFLDEISEMAAGTQAKLLRVLQQKALRPVGSSREVPVDVRVIASTNRDPEEAVRQGKLRQDLYFRISVAVLRVPPLRDRGDDIPVLAQHFLSRSAQALAKDVRGISDEALEVLLDYPWPGNVRELENAMESAATFSRSRTIRVSDLPLTVRRLRSAPGPQREPAAAARPTAPLDDVVTFDQAHRVLVERALRHCAGNRARAARRLGISRKQLYAKIAEYDLEDVGRDS